MGKGLDDFLLFGSVSWNGCYPGIMSAYRLIGFTIGFSDPSS